MPHHLGRVPVLIVTVLCWCHARAAFSSSGCDSTKHCLTLPAGCSTTSSSCVFFSWIWNATDSVFEMELSGGAGNGATYSAVAFGQVDGMEDADLYYCTGNNLESGVIRQQGPPILLDINTEAGITISSTSSTNGVAQCKFKRVASIEKTITDGQKNFNLTSGSYYILLARGAITEGEPQYHGGSNRSISGNRINMATALSTTAPQTAIPTTGVTDVAGAVDCGTNKQCFQYPTDCQQGTANCVTFTWTYNSNDKDFTMAISGGTGNGDTYAGVAFGQFNGMKDADLYYCTGNALHSGAIKAQNKPPTTLDSSVGVSESSASSTNGVARCTFTRPSSVTKAITTGNKDFDLTKGKYYILLAHGNMQDGAPAYHATNRIISSDTIDMASGGSSTKRTSITTILFTLAGLVLVKSQLM